MTTSEQRPYEAAHAAELANSSAPTADENALHHTRMKLVERIPRCNTVLNARVLYAAMRTKEAGRPRNAVTRADADMQKRRVETGAQLVGIAGPLMLASSGTASFSGSMGPLAGVRDGRLISVRDWRAEGDERRAKSVSRMGAGEGRQELDLRGREVVDLTGGEDEETGGEEGSFGEGMESGSGEGIVDRKAEGVGEKTEAIGVKAEATSEKAEVADEKVEAVGEKAEAVGKNAEAAGKKDNVAGDTDTAVGTEDNIASKKDTAADNNDGKNAGPPEGEYAVEELAQRLLDLARGH